MKKAKKQSKSDRLLLRLIKEAKKRMTENETNLKSKKSVKKSTLKKKIGGAKAMPKLLKKSSKPVTMDDLKNLVKELKSYPQTVYVDNRPEQTAADWEASDRGRMGGR